LEEKNWSGPNWQYGKNPKVEEHGFESQELVPVYQDYRSHIILFTVPIKVKAIAHLFYLDKIFYMKRTSFGEI